MRDAHTRQPAVRIGSRRIGAKSIPARSLRR
jgi:hypothetical protein